ncbi:Fanconi anemia group G protein [Protopterus annectens]|uniref:Fanconi anemia group G protein n=1 Tax=Protopterus annectens TaxID=7888 RepID=UPI001CFBCF0D|nr:Fanconi anemia group G protein [Protopterus annectens]
MMARSVELGFIEATTLHDWIEENNDVVRQWRVAVSANTSSPLQNTLQSCHLSLSKLLLKIQGLPPTVHSLPVELKVLYNTVVLDIGVSDCITQKHASMLSQGLCRVLEVQGQKAVGLNSMELWQQILQHSDGEPVVTHLYYLACLQLAVWLPERQLENTKALLQLLMMAPGAVSFDSGKQEQNLLTLFSNWRMFDDDIAVLVVQDIKVLKGILYSCTAFVQGFQKMEEDKFKDAIHILHEAAGGICSRRTLAELYTLIGSCTWKLGKPQTALQYFKQALQTDPLYLTALHQTCNLYQQLGMIDAELGARDLLCRVLQNSNGSNIQSDPACLVQGEMLIRSPALSHYFAEVNQCCAKYTLARRYMQDGRVTEAVEHYLDLLSLFQDNAQQQIFLGTVVTRIPEVYLEAASALIQAEMYHDVISVCDEIDSCTVDLIPEKLTLKLYTTDPNVLEILGKKITLADSDVRVAWWQHSNDSQNTWKQKRERLNAILWTAGAYFLQGIAYTHLKANREAVTYFSRCLHVLFKIQIVYVEEKHCDSVQDAHSEIAVLQKMKSLAFIERGRLFLEWGREKEALQNFQLSLQTAPDSNRAKYFLLHVLWKQNRKQEAVSYWQKYQHSEKVAEHQKAAERDYPLYIAFATKDVNSQEEESFFRMIQEYSRTAAIV